MPETKNLCAQIPADLHAQVTEVREAAGQTTSEYITNLISEYFKLKENGGNPTMASTRTMAFQVSEELFQRIKAHLERETARTGKKVTQREFVLGLIETALNEAEQALTAEAPSGPCEDPVHQDGPQPQAEENAAPSASVWAV